MEGKYIETEVLCISIKPEYAEKIFEGNKRIELRKACPRVTVGDYVIIYVTSPVMAVRGYCKVKDLIVGSPSELWQDRNSELGVDLTTFKNYYEGYDRSVGIELDHIQELDTHISLREIKSILPRFTPPQTFRYLDFKDIRKLNSKDLFNIY